MRPKLYASAALLALLSAAPLAGQEQGTGVEADGTRPVDAQPQTLDGFPATGDNQPQGAAQQPLIDPVAAAPITTEALIGMTVFGAEGDEIGDVDEVLLSEAGEIEALVIDAGGFLGLGAHRVAVAFESADFIESAGMRAIQVAFTEDQLRNQPAYDADSYRMGGAEAVLR